jgi:hypothetical protein
LASCRDSCGTRVRSLACGTGQLRNRWDRDPQMRTALAPTARSTGLLSWCRAGCVCLLVAVVVVGITGALWWFAPGSLTLGDVRVSVLAGVCAAAVSWPAVTATFFHPSAARALLGAPARLHRHRRHGLEPAAVTVPFVSGLALGLVLAVSPW